MVETVGEHSERERLNVSHRLVPAFPIRQDTRKIGDFGNPATVILPLDPNGSRLSCGRKAHGRKAAEPKEKLGGEATQFFHTCERPAASSAC